MARIVVSIEEEGTAMLDGLVPDLVHKEAAVILARDTRGGERVVDRLTSSLASRTIEAPAAAVPTGVASAGRLIR